MAYNCEELSYGQLEIKAACINNGVIVCAKQVPNLMLNDCESYYNGAVKGCNMINANVSLNCFDKSINKYVYQDIKKTNVSNKITKNIIFMLFINLILFFMINFK